MDYVQNYNPWPWLGTPLVSLLAAALPVVVLFHLLVVRRMSPPAAAASGALAAFLVATLVYRMPVSQATMAFLSGAAFGLVPVAWVVVNAMFFHNLTVVTGKFEIIRRSVAGVSPDHRLQAVLIGFSFGAFLEGAAGGGAPVAISSALLAGLGFDPFLAAGLCLIANTSPVAFGALGTPILTLSRVTGLEADALAAMAGTQLPLLSCLIPFWMVRSMVGWRETLEVLPALLVSGVSFAACQYLFAHHRALWGLTDLASGIASLLAVGGLLVFWKPRRLWRFGADPRAAPAPGERLLPGTVLAGWVPFGILFVLFAGLGFLQRRLEGTPEHPVRLGPIPTVVWIEAPGLHGRVLRGEAVLSPQQRALPVALRTREEAVFRLNWLTTPGSIVLMASALSILFLRPSARQIAMAARRTAAQMKIPVPTIAAMMGLGFITRYGGSDATLGLAFTRTGALYPFFAPLLGWLGVFLTGTDAASNALFGSLQKITAQGLGLSPILICAANSTGGVMGKMIDAQSLCVATAATDQVGRESDLFKFVVWPSAILAVLVGLVVLIQAYWFTPAGGPLAGAGWP
jgi:lactate permease